LWNSLPLAQRVALGLVIGGIVIACSFLFTGVMRAPGGKVPLLDGYVFTPEEIAGALRGFATANLTDFETQGGQILVPRGREATYLAAVSQAGALPGNFYQAFEDYVTRQSTWWVSNQRDQRLFREAKARQLAKVIEAYAEIDRAAVSVSDVPPVGLRRAGQITASVQLFTKAGRPLRAQTKNNIAQLVAGAFGLTADRVNVLVDTGRAADAAAARSLGSEEIEAKSPYLQAILWYDEHIKRKLAEVFEEIVGVEVTAHVELNPELNVRQQSAHYEKGVPASLQSTERSSGTSAGAARGEPGVSPNVDVRTAANQPAAAASSTETEETTNTVFQNPSTTKIWELADYPNHKVTGVVVRVPRQYLEPPAAGQPATTPQITEAEIQGVITALNLPGLQSGNIRVLRYTPIEPPVVEPPGIGSRIAELLFANLGSIGLAVLGLLAVFATLILVRRTVVPEIPAVKPAEAVGKPPVEEVPVLPEIAPEARRVQKMEEAIAAMASKEPSAAGALLRRWVQEEQA
jgi:flagellar biosynthesis/type III secretory pathway M-ring protein FliF/YscJ